MAYRKLFLKPPSKPPTKNIMKLIVGLGNPGRQYQNTPHNAGFDVVNLLADRHRGQWALERRFDAETCDIRIGDKSVTLMKPLTYMNLSGRAVAQYRTKNGGEPHEILAISDDFNLPLGQLRMRPSGSHGGHNGLLSLINSLGTLDYPRLRLGVRPEGAQITDWVGFVLKPLLPRERELLKQCEEDAADAIEMVLTNGFNAAMNHFNRKRPAT